MSRCWAPVCLLATVVGSGIMGEHLGGGNDALALLANTLATATALYVLIAIFGPASGAHFNPAVTLVLRLHGERTPGPLWAYLLAQIAGAIAGVLLAHAMFDQPWAGRRHGPGSRPPGAWRSTSHAAHLDGIAQPLLAGGLADEAPVDALAARSMTRRMASIAGPSSSLDVPRLVGIISSVAAPH